MPDVGAWGPSLAIGLVLVVMLWFTLGTQRNVRKGNEILRWLQGGLPILGSRTTLRWLGSSAVELGIAEASAPFRDATLVVVLEPRDVGLLWAFSRSRGRRDFLIVRANLRRAPRFSLQAAHRSAWTARDEASDPSLTRVHWPGDGVDAWASEGADERAARAAWERLGKASGGVWKLTVQPLVPHLEVHVLPPDLDQVPADRLLSTVADLGRELSRA